MLSLSDTFTGPDMSVRKHVRVREPAGPPAQIPLPEEQITYPKGHPEFSKGSEEAKAPERVTVDIQGMIDETLQGKKFNIEPADAFKSGKELLNEIHPAPISGVILQIESGRKEMVMMDMPLLEKDVYGVTLPGVKAQNSHYPPNQDGIVMSYDSIDRSLTTGIIHNGSVSEEGAAIANVESVSAAYDLAKLRTPALTEMFFRMNSRAAPIERELGNSFPHAALMRMTPMESGLYNLDVASNGGFRCMVIDSTGRFETNQPIDASDDAEFLSLIYSQPISTVLDTMAESGADSDKQIITDLRQRLEVGKFTEDQVRQFLRNLMLEPKIQSLIVAPDDIVVLVPEVAIEEFGGPEAFVQYFSTLVYRNNQSLQKVCRAIMETLERTMKGETMDGGTENGDTVGFEDILKEVYPDEQQAKESPKEKKPLLEQSLSIIAFEAPQILDK